MIPSRATRNGHQQCCWPSTLTIPYPAQHYTERQLARWIPVKERNSGAMPLRGSRGVLVIEPPTAVHHHDSSVTITPRSLRRRLGRARPVPRRSGPGTRRRRSCSILKALARPAHHSAPATSPVPTPRSTRCSSIDVDADAVVRACRKPGVKPAGGRRVRAAERSFRSCGGS